MKMLVFFVHFIQSLPGMTIISEGFELDSAYVHELDESSFNDHQSEISIFWRNANNGRS